MTGSGMAESRCIACSGDTVEQFLDLGETALANKFLTAEQLAEPEARYPLRVGFCHACDHVQLTDLVPPSAMFEDYLYISSVSETLRDHLHDLADIVVERHRPGPSGLVIDIGCNDGTLLSGFSATACVSSASIRRRISRSYRRARRSTGWWDSSTLPRPETSSVGGERRPSSRRRTPFRTSPHSVTS